MVLGEIIFYTAVSIIFLNLLYVLFQELIKGSKTDREYERKLQESLAEEYIIDPETGTKLTLEQAESGHWISHDNEFRTVPETEISKYYSPEEKEAERALNYLRESKEYLKHIFSDEEIGILETTNILSKYDGWGYSNPFRLEYCEGFVFMPAVEWIDKVPGYFESGYNESQIMFWIKYDVNFGHYYFREKSGTEKFLDIIKSDDEIKLNRYECFTFKKAENIFLLKDILDRIQKQDIQKIEIEFMGRNLFLKTQKLINQDELLMLEQLARNISS